MRRGLFKVQVARVQPAPGGRKLVKGEEATMGPVVVTLSAQRADSDLVAGSEIILSLPVRTTRAELRRAIREPVHHLIAGDGETGLFTMPKLTRRSRTPERIPFLRQSMVV